MMPASSLETEISIVGTLLCNPKLLGSIYGVLRPEDFYHPVPRYLFRSILELVEASLDVNVQTLSNHLVKNNYDGITPSELSEYLDYRVPSEVLSSLASQLSEFSGYRILELELERLARLARERELSLGSLVGELSGLSKKINEKGLSNPFKTGASLVDSYLAMLDRDRSIFKLTGIPSIDSRIVDLDAKELTYIAARPGTGKTAVMLQSARVNLEAGRRVGFVSLEMDSSKVINRIISSRAGFDGAELLRLRPSQLPDSVVEALDWIKQQPLFVDDSGPFTSQNIVQKLRKLYQEHGVEIIYVDYVGLISASGHLAAQSRNYQLSQISADLKGLAMELSIPIVAASQLNREVAKRTSSKPQLSDMRDSGSLEQDASLVLFLYVDMNKFLTGGLKTDDVDEYMSTSNSVSLRLEVAKQRNGAVFSEPVFFERRFGRFVRGTIGGPIDSRADS